MKANLTSFFAAICLCFVINAHLNAQTEDIITRKYTMKEGLSHSYVLCLLQDSQGFLWIGTFSGLNKFDGYHFTTYQENPLDSNSLSNNWISCLWEDRQQRLWIGTIKGLELFDLTTEKFSDPLPDSLNPIKGVHIREIRERRDGKVWICTDQGVYLADPQTLSMTRMILFPQDVDEKTFGDITEAKDGSVWAAGWGGLVHIDGVSGQTTHYRHDPEDPHSLSHNHVLTVHIDHQDRVWVGTRQGLDLLNPVDQAFTHFLPEHLQSIQLHVYDLLEHADGKFWVASGDGLYTFDPETEKFDLFVDQHVESILQDRQSNIWLGDIGLFQIAPQSKRFNRYRQFRQTEGFNNGSVFSENGRVYIEDANHYIWFTTLFNDNTVFRFNPSTSHLYKYQHDPNNPHSYSCTNIKDIVPDPEGGVWLAANGQIEKFNPQNQTFTSYPLPFQVWTILKDSEGRMWLGEPDGAGIFDPQTGTYERLISLPLAWVHTIVEDREKNLWIGTSEIQGLFSYSLKTGQLDVYKHNPADPQSLSNNRNYYLMKDQEGTIWVGTGGGLNKLIPGTESEEPKFAHWRTTNSDLPDDDVWYIIDGEDGTLWLTCGNRVSHFFPHTGEFRNYDHHDGLSGNPIGWGVRTHAGEIYFSTHIGLVTFHPDSLQDNSFTPPVAITHFSIHNQSVPVSGSYGDTLSWASPITQTIPYTDEVVLTYKQNDFAFEFAALNFVNPENNLYKYKLEPYEADWVETSANNRIARYTNLDPGQYTFRVIGSNNDGLWNEEGKSLGIIIHPPWWQTWWAYALYALLALGALWSVRHYEMKRLRLRQRAVHLAEVDTLKTRFFANISHEFRTPLTLILGPLKEMYEGTFTGDRKAVFGVMIRNGQRLLNLINQLLDISKLEAGKMQLHATSTDLIALLRHIASSYESIATGKKIKYFFYPEMQELMVYADQEKIKKIVHNLLSNAFKFTPEGGEVILHLKTQENQWALVSVKDTGTGIPAEELDKVFNRFYQVDSSQTRLHEGSGLGMAVVKELVEIHHGRITVESKEGKGTTFTIWLPLGKGHLRPEEISEQVDAETSEKYPYQLVGDTEEVVEEENDAAMVETNNNPLILVVEDNADMRHYIRSTLENDYQVREAENGKEGLILAKELLPDLILSDIMMPEMDGFRVCERIKTHELTSHIPVILLTAKADRQSKLAGLETGADDYLSKPFDAEELKLIVRNRIEERRKLRERFSKDITLEPRSISITSLDEQFLRKVLDIIEAHMDDESYTIEDLGREGGYSKVHFYRKIKALSGQSPSQFLRTIRLKRAAELLQQKSDTISQIAYRVGFNNLSYFNKCFKEQFGITPKQYAKASQEIE